MNLQQIYDNLFAGKILEIQFSSKDDMDLFKIKLHQLRRRQETQMIDIGVMDPSEQQMISFNFIGGTGLENDWPRTFIIAMSNRPARKEYTVKIVE